MKTNDLMIKNFLKTADWYESTGAMLKFPMSRISIEMLRNEFEYELSRKPMHRLFKENYFVDYGNTFNLNAYFKYHLFGELKSVRYKACVMDTPKYPNLVIIVEK